MPSTHMDTHTTLRYSDTLTGKTAEQIQIGRQLKGYRVEDREKRKEEGQV